MAAGCFFMIVGLAAIVWYSMGRGVPILTGSSLSFAGIFAVVLGYILTVGGFYVYTREKKAVIKEDWLELQDKATRIDAMNKTIAAEHPRSGNP